MTQQSEAGIVKGSLSGNPEHDMQLIQPVALVETGAGLQNIFGFPVTISHLKDEKGRLAVTEIGLVRIKMVAGQVWDNSVEPTHVDRVTFIDMSWDEIWNLTGISKSDAQNALSAFHKAREQSTSTTISSGPQPEGRDESW